MGEVGSTLDVAQESAGQYPNPTWFTATRQTVARGRRGRVWIAPEGNFAATLTLPIKEPATAAFRSFIAALALAEAIDVHLKDAERVTLKWPNDVLIDGRKVAGILLESLSAQNRIWGVAIGIGVNLAEAPPLSSLEKGAVMPISLAAASGTLVSPDGFLAHIAPAFAAWESTFQTGGFAPIRTAWLARAARLGEVITARTVRETFIGTFDTIDDAGQLVMKAAEGRIKVPAADVFF